MKEKFTFPENELPPEGLEFFYKLTTWYEDNEKTKLHSLGSKIKKLNLLNIIRPEKGKKLSCRTSLSSNTIYLPVNNFGAKAIICNIRNAFCHHGINYNKDTQQYIIRRTEKIHIDASFSLDALSELSIFIKQQKKNNNKI